MGHGPSHVHVYFSLVPSDELLSNSPVMWSSPSGKVGVVSCSFVILAFNYTGPAFAGQCVLSNNCDLEVTPLRIFSRPDMFK